MGNNSDHCEEFALSQISKLKLLTVMVLSFVSYIANSEVLVRDRHIMIIYPGVDAIWGNYLFMMSNEGDEPIRYQMDLMLPKETVDWQAQDSLSANDILLAEGGGLRLNKMIPPGNHLMSIGFKIPATGGTANLTIAAAFEIGQLGLFIGDQDMIVQAEGFAVKKNVPFSGRMYDTYTADNVPAGTTVQALIRGVPEGRGRFWAVGGVVGAVLLGLGGFAAYRTMPKSDGVEAEVLS